MERVVHDGRETAYRHARPEGDGPGVVYVHGSGGSHRVWTPQYGPNGPVQPAIAVDLSGHGESDDVETEPGPETLYAYADDVVAVARDTGASVLVGNSLGGAIVQTIAIESGFDPDLEGVVLAGTGAKLTVLENLRNWLDSDYERAIEFLHGNDRLFHDPDDRIVEHSKAEMRAAGQVVTRRDYLTCHEFDVRDRLDGIDVPTLAIVGEHDGLTPVSYHEYLAEHVSRCELAVLEDTAHLAMLERADAFNDRLESFLAGL